ncbi:hypothetical protein [Nocardioides terrae]|uniref:hypothetical protein n=1 Tax=Nocardioides terrae TaxID=574651 RepID=UPI000B80606C|nr:hypothetical protein [Nocardioides terrae]
MALALITTVSDVGGGAGSAVEAVPSGPVRPESAVIAAVAEPPVLAEAQRSSRRVVKTKHALPPSAVRRLFNTPFHKFSRHHGKRPWWNTRSGISGADWVYPYFPTACYQRDRAAGGTNASAWQVLWVHPDDQPSAAARHTREVRLMVRGGQSLFAASAGRYLRNRRQLYTRSLAPRFVTTRGCQADVHDVAVPAGVYNTGHVWDGSTSATPFGSGTLTEWLQTHGYNAPNRKYVVFLQSSPFYAHGWTGISEDLANSAQSGANETPTLDNPANFSSFSYVDLSWFLDGSGDLGELSYPTQVMVHEMIHGLGAMTPSAPHESATNPLHPTDCWDLLCYNPPTGGQTYTNGCGNASGWKEWRLARGYMRLDCNRDDYWAPATDTGLAAAAWTKKRWAVSSSSFLYGNPQPSESQLATNLR